MSAFPRPALSLMILWTFAGAACRYEVYSPPARALPLESVATVPAGTTGLALEGGPGGAIFGPDLAFGTARIRYAMDDQLEAVVEPSLIHVLDNSSVSTHPTIYALRGGAKLKVARALALTGGMGGGYSAGGAFLTPDLGAVIAYENAYFVPFLSARGYVSQPLMAQEVLLSSEDNGDGTTSTRVGTPRFSVGLGLVLGARIPIASNGAPVGAISLGVGLVNTADRDSNQTYSGLNVGVELLLD